MKGWPFRHHTPDIGNKSNQVLSNTKSMHDLLNCNISQSVMTRTHWEMLIKSTLDYISLQSTLTNTIIGCVVVSSSKDRYSLWYELIDFFVTTATFDRTIKVVLSSLKAHNIENKVHWWEWFWKRKISNDYLFKMLFFISKLRKSVNDERRYSTAVFHTIPSNKFFTWNFLINCEIKWILSWIWNTRASD